MIIFLNYVIKNHFIPLIVKKLFIFARTANKLLDHLQAYKIELDLKTLKLDWSTDHGNNSSKKHKLDLTLHKYFLVLRY